MSLDVLSRDYDGGSPDIPEATADVYRAGDLMRDLHYVQDKAGRTLADLLAVAKPYISGGVVTKGSGDTLDITPAVGYVPFEVKVPDSYASNPPTVKNEDTYRRVASTQQTNMAVGGATLDGATPNYVKLAYAETNGPTRARLKGTGTYVYVKVDSFVITVTPAAGTAYELVLATFTGTGGGAFTITDLTPDFTDLARSLADDVDAAAMLTTLGITAFIQTLLDDADAATARTTLGAVGLTGNETIAGIKTFSSAIVSDVTGDLTGGIVETGAGTDTLKCKVVQMGDWDMDATASIDVAHGLADGTKVRMMQALVRRDDDVDNAIFDLSIGSSGASSHIWVVDNTNIRLSRDGSSFFDSTSFNKTSFNRGWVTFWYEV